MSSTNKRGRGRPHGTGLNDDKALREIADLLQRYPSLRPTTAIKRVLRNPGSATIRRLQVKWKAQGDAYLDMARERRDAETAARSPSGHINYGKIALATGALRGVGGATAIFDALNSPALRAMREMENSSAMRLMREIDKMPSMRLMRELQDSPQMRIMREMDKITRLTRGY